MSSRLSRWLDIDCAPPWALTLSVALIPLALFFPAALTSDFVSLDDGLLILSNPFIRVISPWSLRNIFTSFDPELYIPLTFFSYQLNELVGGLHPAIFHLTNLALHSLSAVLVFHIVRRLSGNSPVAFLTAILFGIHPLQTEAVMWASARKDVLSAFFFLGSLLMYLRYIQMKNGSLFFASLFFFLLALLSKVSIITLPLLLIAIDIWRGKRFDRGTILRLAPFFLLSVIFGIVAMIGKSAVLDSTDPWTTLILAAKSTFFYLRLIFWPFGFSVVYPQETPVGLQSLEFIGPIIGVLGLLTILAASFSAHRRNSQFSILDSQFVRRLWLPLAWFFVLLIPNYTNFIKNGSLFFGSDRYAYLACIGIFWIVAHMLYTVLRNRNFFAIITLAIVMLAPVSWAQAKTWRSSEALYINVIRQYPNSALAYNNLGDVLIRANRIEQGYRAIEEAIKRNTRLIAAHINMGNGHRERGEFEKAMEEYRIAIREVEAKPTINEGDLAGYYLLGEVLESLGRDAEALAQFEAAIARAPIFGEPHFNYGVKLHQRGRKEDARREYKFAISASPFYIPAMYNLAAIEAEFGNLQAAAGYLARVLVLDPGHQKAREHLQKIRGMLKD